jgi:hypothetical protein
VRLGAAELGRADAERAQQRAKTLELAVGGRELRGDRHQLVCRLAPALSGVRDHLVEPALEPPALGVECQRVRVAGRQRLLDARERRRAVALSRRVEQLADVVKQGADLSGSGGVGFPLRRLSGPRPRSTWAARPILSSAAAHRA